MPLIWKVREESRNFGKAGSLGRSSGVVPGSYTFLAAAISRKVRWPGHIGIGLTQPERSLFHG